jgi:hypothetical protein
MTWAHSALAVARSVWRRAARRASAGCESEGGRAGRATTHKSSSLIANLGCDQVVFWVDAFRQECGPLPQTRAPARCGGLTVTKQGPGSKKRGRAASTSCCLPSPPARTSNRTPVITANHPHRRLTARPCSQSPAARGPPRRCRSQTRCGGTPGGALQWGTWWGEKVRGLTTTTHLAPPPPPKKQQSNTLSPGIHPRRSTRRRPAAAARSLPRRPAAPPTA